LAKLGIKSGGKQFFDVWVKEADVAYANLEKQLGLAIESLRASGIKDSEIFARLKADLDNKTDLFSSFSGDVEGANNDLFHLESQLASAEEVAGASDLFEWTLDPTAEHCGDCLANADKEPMSFDEWQAEGLPGMGNTDCGEYCKCSLDPVGDNFQEVAQPVPDIIPSATSFGEDVPNLKGEILDSRSAAEMTWEAGGKEFEHAVLTADDGTVIFNKSGDANSVKFTSREVDSFLGSNLAHNHPSGASFSPEDIVLAARSGLKSMAAVGEDFIYVIEPQAEGWTRKSNEAIKRAWENARDDLNKKYEKVWFDAMDRGVSNARDYAWRLHSDELMQNLSKELHFDYRKLKR
jgi:hypothetical protein